MDEIVVVPDTLPSRISDPGYVLRIADPRMEGYLQK